MKRLRIVSAATCAMFLASMVPWGVALAKPKKPEPPAPVTSTSVQGRLRIQCPVDGARWEIDEGTDGAVKGMTPLGEPLALPAGTHTIRVSKEGFLPYSDVFDVTPGGTTEIEIDMALYSGRLRVDAQPVPVEVNVDGKPWGPAPVTVELSIGEHVIRLTKPGYVEEVRKTAIKTGQTTDLAVKLLPEAEVQVAAAGEPIYKKWWFWTVLGAVAAGVVIPTVILTRGKAEPAHFDGQPITLP